MGFSMSSDEFVSLHDVYEGLNDEEKCQKTSYILQFLWRDLSSDFSVIGPYFNCSSSVFLVDWNFTVFNMLEV